MKTPLLFGFLFSVSLSLGVAQQPVPASSPAIPADRAREMTADRSSPDYPTPYEPAKEAEIQAVLQRVHAYLQGASGIRVTDRETKQPVPDLKKLPANIDVQGTGYRIISYEWGVTYAGMLLAADVTGDVRYRDYVAERMDAIARVAAHYREQGDAVIPKEGRRFFFRSVLKPQSLDDSGAMCAAMIKSVRSGVNVEITPWIDRYMAYIGSGQKRFEDGTLARNRPMKDTLWLDDLYMSVPALAQMGALTGDARYLDDAARQILQFSDRMFVREKGLYMHGWVKGMEPHPAFHWGRANGWAFMAMAELLDVLPVQHPARPRILELFRAQARGLAAVQGANGLWHQLLDRPDSYDETSASAMYVFGIARGINRGWLDEAAYGPMVSVAWNAVAKKVNAQGQVEGTCIGTGMGWEPMFYCFRPASPYAAHGYGPVLLAGSEMILLRRGKGAVAAIRDGGLHYRTMAE
ncbi:family 88 glycosyl hydrolase [Opitutaceae bacterium EW11]|nr:family 88 glycosyl hydrolase [Opitutaceae bacterium EW11]